MTPKTLQAWRMRMDWSRARASRHLGLSPNGYAAYEHGKPVSGGRKARPIPKYIALACAAIEQRIDPLD